MLIRTQDKRSLVDITGTTISIDNYTRELSTGTIYQYNIKIFVHSNMVTETLGRYSSFEKAMKVLNMIQVKYESANSNQGYPGAFVANTVFIMPADEEV